MGFKKKKMIIIYLLCVVSIAILIFWYFGLHNLIVRHKGERVGKAVWEDMGPTPLSEKKYTPQGMAWAGNKLVIANSWDNKRSRVYEIEPSNMEILRHFDMPPEAVHTSGLTWDGKHLWAVDYISNKGYCIDLEESFEAAQAKVIGEFDTTLKGTSACCIVPWEGREYLAISDFMRTKRTIFVRMHEAIKKGSAEGLIDFEYSNEGFSQGLEFAEGFLYESENKLGTNVVNKIDLGKLKETKKARRATVKQYPAPDKGVEDLAWDGEYMWTSDEAVFRFFKGKLE
jgi:glutamine cyclotransferase